VTQPTAAWQDFEGVWHLCHCRPWPIERRLVGMALGILIFFLLITLASMAGKVADTRDSADWKPTDGGFRHTT